MLLESLQKLIMQKGIYSPERWKWMIDLENIIIESLKRQGLREDNIFRCNICTKCHKEIFFLIGAVAVNPERPQLLL